MLFCPNLVTVAASVCTFKNICFRGVPDFCANAFDYNRMRTHTETTGLDVLIRVVNTQLFVGGCNALALCVWGSVDGKERKSCRFGGHGGGSDRSRLTLTSSYSGCAVTTVPPITPNFTRALPWGGTDTVSICRWSDKRSTSRLYMWVSICVCACVYLCMYLCMYMSAPALVGTCVHSYRKFSYPG